MQKIGKKYSHSYLYYKDISTIAECHFNVYICDHSEFVIYIVNIIAQIVSQANYYFLTSF